MASGEAGQGLPSLVMEPFLYTPSQVPGLVPRAAASHPRPSSAEATSFHPRLAPTSSPLGGPHPHPPQGTHSQKLPGRPSNLPVSTPGVLAAWPRPGDGGESCSAPSRGREGGGRLGKQAGARCRNSGPGRDLCSARCLRRGGDDAGGCGEWGGGGAWEAAVCVRAAPSRRGEERKGRAAGRSAGTCCRRARGAGAAVAPGRGGGRPAGAESAPGAGARRLGLQSLGPGLSAPASLSSGAPAAAEACGPGNCSILLSQQGGSRDCPGREVWRPGHRWVCASALPSDSASACPGVGAGVRGVPGL